MMRRFAVIAVLFGLTAGAAQAQYYQQPPNGYPPAPDGYAPPGNGGYPPPEGPPPRAEGYGYGGYGPPGRSCSAYFETQYGPRQRVCPMGVAKPVGAPCACPPRGPYGPTAQGQVIP